MKTVSAVALAALSSTALAALTPVTTNGNAFFAGANRFYVRGVDYQPGGSSILVDPIANITTCTRDIAEFKKLGINTVRVYTVDNQANHDACMAALDAAGIYLALDVNTPKYSINRANPAPSYNAVYLQSVFATIDAFAKYSNTLLFFSGNEVINDDTNTNCAPYIKAITRDMRQYIKSRSYRSIPVGYSAADVAQNRYQTAQYMNCGDDAMARSDFFSFNDYSWCDPNTFEGSGWAAKVQMYMNYSIPLFLSEYGCNQNPPRAFQEVAALYNPEMTNVYSGGLVYEYSEEAGNANYGLVNIVSTTAVTEKADFTNLQAMLAANPAPAGNGGFQTGLAPQACPTSDAHWNVANSATLPAFPAAASPFLTGGAGTGPGLTGVGSQNGGVVSSIVVVTTSTAGSASGASRTATATATATVTSGAATTATSRAAAASIQIAAFDKAPLVISGLVAALTFFGASLL